MAALEDSLKFLDDGGKVAILDGTNTTFSRRQKFIDFAEVFFFFFLFGFIFFFFFFFSFLVSFLVSFLFSFFFLFYFFVLFFFSFFFFIDLKDSRIGMKIFH